MARNNYFVGILACWGLFTSATQAIGIQNKVLRDPLKMR